MTFFVLMGLISPLAEVAQARTALDVSQSPVMAALDQHGLLESPIASNDRNIRSAFIGSQNQVVMQNGSYTLEIGLPNTASDLQRSVITDAVVGFPTADSVEDVVQFLESDSGQSVRLMTFIKQADAPNHFEYDLKLPAGATIQLTHDGGAVVIDGITRDVIAVVDAPWAKDANGEDVPTRYIVNGGQLVQEIDHQGAAYPVIADPRFSWGWTGFTVYFSSWETRLISWGGIGVLAGAGLTGVGAGVVAAVIAAAQYYIDQGWCLSAYKPYVGYWLSFWAYRC
jgi:hypothetical protein